MAKKAMNQKHVSLHMKPTRKEVLAASGHSGLAVLAVVLVVEVVLFYSDFEAFTILFGQVVGDDTARPIAVALSATVPVFTYLIVGKMASKIDESRYDKAVYGLLAGMAILCLLCFVARFALEAQSLSTGGDESWVVNGLLYSLPLLAAVLGSASGALVSSDPRSKRAAMLVKLRFREIELESEREALMNNRPSSLADQVKRCFSEAQKEAALSLQSHIALALLDCMTEYQALEEYSVREALSGGLCASIIEATIDPLVLPDTRTDPQFDTSSGLLPWKTTHQRVIESWEAERAAEGNGSL